MGLQIRCGDFSYAEIPKIYVGILGVTGTLKSLGSFENKVVKDVYGIRFQTFTPSIYGESRLAFREQVDVVVEHDLADYHRGIKEQLQQAAGQGRAALAFFATDVEMQRWLDSGYAEGVEGLVAVKRSTSNMDHYVRRATRAGSVTLFSAVHGRGLDFAVQFLVVAHKV